MNLLFSTILSLDKKPAQKYNPLTFVALEDNSSLNLEVSNNTVNISKIEVKVNNR